MTLALSLSLLLVGLCIGIVSGMVGIGGGILVIPVLTLIYGLSQTKANGTSLAMMLPPIGVFAVMAYSRAGNVDWTFAGLLAAGFALGAYLGARLINDGLINPTALRIGFALLLVYCAARILFRSGGQSRVALETAGLVMCFGLIYGLGRLLGRQWAGSPSQWGQLFRQRRHLPVEHDYEI